MGIVENGGWLEGWVEGMGNKDLFSAGLVQDLRGLFCMLPCYVWIEKSVDSLELTNTPERLR